MSRFLLFWSSTVLLAACAEPPPDVEPTRDGGDSVAVDGGHPAQDAGHPTPDAGLPDPDPDPGPDPHPDAILPTVCALEAEGRLLVDELVDKLAADSMWMASEAHGLHSPFALNLVGNDEAHYLGVASLAMPCEGQLWYEPYCESDDGGVSIGGGGSEPASSFFEGRNRCTRFGCAGPGIYAVQAYITEAPREDPSDRHPLTYPLTTFEGGTVAWDPNPLTTWYMRAVSSSRSHVWGDIDREMTVTLADGRTIDLDHAGTVSIETERGHLTSLRIELMLDVQDGAPLQLDIEIDRAGSLSGALFHGPVVYARWSGTSAEGGARLDWLGACAE